MQFAKPISSHPALAGGFVPGTLIADRYRVVAQLGRGGMGEVYGADDLTLGQRVALKFLPAERNKNAEWREQLFAEVRMSRQVSHPNVCRMYDVGESAGRVFLSMEFVDGEDLASLLRRIGRLPDDKAVEVARQLCAGLGAAHRAGVLHRDLKPANVMIDGRGLARITDFGLAIATNDAGGIANPAGTPGYMAPEVLEGASPSVQSDLYALGLVLYEVFTGKRAFNASGLNEWRRVQTESSPTPPSSLVKNLDPTVERAILRCLDPDPTRRPTSALSVAAALPGGDPLAAAIAAGETPSPQMVAAAGPQGSLRPAVAWTLLATTIVLIIGTSVFLAPHATDWGLAPAEKSPEVLGDRAQELAKKLGYADAVDRTFWVEAEKDYRDYVTAHPAAKDWRQAANRAWPAPISFFYRQSSNWMTPMDSTQGPPMVTLRDPGYETAGMVAIKLDTQGHLLFLRSVPPQLESGETSREPNWDALFVEAGLDKSQFRPASPKWAPPDAFDSRADWEGHLADAPDLPLHISAAAYHGKFTYFQVIAPWDKPWRGGAGSKASIASSVSLAAGLVFLIGFVVIGGFFARRNIRRGRGDIKGGLRLVTVAAVLNCIYALFSYHLVPDSNYIGNLFLDLGIPLLFALTAWIGYMAVEPYARRTWPMLMVSWQRLLSGNWRDPLLGRDVLIGGFSGSILILLLEIIGSYFGLSETSSVNAGFGRSVWTAVGVAAWTPSAACFLALGYLAVLSIATGILRRRWLGLIVTAGIFLLQSAASNVLDAVVSAFVVLALLAILIRVGLVAAAVMQLVAMTLSFAPPLTMSRWYAGRGAIALLIPLALVVYGFYVSLGDQPAFGTALQDD